MLFKQAIFTIFIFSFANSLIFRVRHFQSGFFLPLLKSKGVGYLFGEDAFATSPYIIALADGVSKSYFPACHLARALTTSIVEFFHLCYQHHLRFKAGKSENACELLDMSPKQAFVKTMILPMLKSEFLKTVEEANSIEKEKLPQLPPKALIASSTFIGAYITESKIPLKANLKILQKGDTLILILRYDPLRKNWKAYMQSRESQTAFNKPFQFVSVDADKNNEFQEAEMIVDIQENDIVIFGSDGIFDNIPVPIITFAVNYYFKKSIEHAEKKIPSTLCLCSPICLKSISAC